MAQSAPGITVGSLQQVSRWFTDEETLKGYRADWCKNVR